MSSPGLWGNKNAGTGHKNKFQPVNISSIHSGKSLLGQKSSGPAKHGLQSLGKQTAVVRRMPPPAPLPSLRAESQGQDPNVNLVPSGGAGWGTQEQPASNGTHNEHQKTGTAGSSGVRAGAAASRADLRPSWNRPEESQTAQAPAATAGYLNREFPSLDAAGDASKAKDPGGPSLRPQKIGSWKSGGGSALSKTTENETQENAYVNGNKNAKEPSDPGPMPPPQQSHRYYPQQQGGYPYGGYGHGPPPYPMQYGPRPPAPGSYAMDRPPSPYGQRHPPPVAYDPRYYPMQQQQRMYRDWEERGPPPAEWEYEGHGYPAAQPASPRYAQPPDWYRQQAPPMPMDRRPMYGPPGHGPPGPMSGRMRERERDIETEEAEEQRRRHEQTREREAAIERARQKRRLAQQGSTSSAEAVPDYPSAGDNYRGEFDEAASDREAERPTSRDGRGSHGRQRLPPRLQRQTEGGKGPEGRPFDEFGGEGYYYDRYNEYNYDDARPPAPHYEEENYRSERRRPPQPYPDYGADYYYDRGAHEAYGNYEPQPQQHQRYEEPKHRASEQPPGRSHGRRDRNRPRGQQQSKENVEQAADVKVLQRPESKESAASSLDRPVSEGSAGRPEKGSARNYAIEAPARPVILSESVERELAAEEEENLNQMQALSRPAAKVVRRGTSDKPKDKKVSAPPADKKQSGGAPRDSAPRPARQENSAPKRDPEPPAAPPPKNVWQQRMEERESQEKEEKQWDDPPKLEDERKGGGVRRAGGRGGSAMRGRREFVNSQSRRGRGASSGMYGGGPRSGGGRRGPRRGASVPNDASRELTPQEETTPNDENKAPPEEEIAEKPEGQVEDHQQQQQHLQQEEQQEPVRGGGRGGRGPPKGRDRDNRRRPPPPSMGFMGGDPRMMRQYYFPFMSPGMGVPPRGRRGRGGMNPGRANYGRGGGRGNPRADGRGARGSGRGQPPERVKDENGMEIQRDEQIEGEPQRQGTNKGAPRYRVGRGSRQRRASGRRDARRSRSREVKEPGSQAKSPTTSEGHDEWETASESSDIAERKRMGEEGGSKSGRSGQRFSAQRRGGRGKPNLPQVTWGPGSGPNRRRRKEAHDAEGSASGPKNVKPASHRGSLTNERTVKSSSLAAPESSNACRSDALAGVDINNIAGVVVIDDHPDLETASLGSQLDGFEEVVSRKEKRLRKEMQLQVQEKAKEKKDNKWSNKQSDKRRKSASSDRRRRSDAKPSSTSSSFFKSETSSLPPVSVWDEAVANQDTPSPMAPPPPVQQPISEPDPFVSVTKFESAPARSEEIPSKTGVEIWGQPDLPFVVDTFAEKQDNNDTELHRPLQSQSVEFVPEVAVGSNLAVDGDNFDFTFDPTLPTPDHDPSPAPAPPPPPAEPVAPDSEQLSAKLSKVRAVWPESNSEAVISKTADQVVSAAMFGGATAETDDFGSGQVQEKRPVVAKVRPQQMNPPDQVPLLPDVDMKLSMLPPLSSPASPGHAMHNQGVFANFPFSSSQPPRSHAPTHMFGLSQPPQQSVWPMAQPPPTRPSMMPDTFGSNFGAGGSQMMMGTNARTPPNMSPPPNKMAQQMFSIQTTGHPTFLAVHDPTPPPAVVGLNLSQPPPPLLGPIGSQRGYMPGQYMSQQPQPARVPTPPSSLLGPAPQMAKFGQMAAPRPQQQPPAVFGQMKPAMGYGAPPPKAPGPYGQKMQQRGIAPIQRPGGPHNRRHNSNSSAGSGDAANKHRDGDLLQQIDRFINSATDDDGTKQGTDATDDQSALMCGGEQA